MELTEIYDTLKQHNLCKNGRDFSLRYLGKTKNYYSVLLAKKIAPSTQTLLTLHFTLCDKINSTEEPADISSYRAKQDLITMSNIILSNIKSKCKIT